MSAGTITKDIAYGYKRLVPVDVDEAERRLREQLANEGFGILTEIDVRSTFKKKLDVEFRPYKILGDDMAPLATRVLDMLRRAIDAI
jgi:uncharacterized protein (DUF302 family)